MRASLARPLAERRRPVSAAKPTTTWPGAARSADELGEDVGVADQLDAAAGSSPSFFLILRGGVARPGRKSATAAAITTASASGGGLEHRLAQLARRCRPDDVDAGRVGQRDVGGDQGDLGAAGGGGAGERVALLARGAVAEEADRVERLAGAAGGDDDVPAGEVGRGRGAAGQHPAADREDLGGLGQPALAGVGAGEPADGGLEDDDAAAAQGGDVGLGGGVLPHLGVHRGREDDRAAGGEQGVGEQVVGEAVGGPGQQVGGGRGDDDEVGLLAEPHVRHLVDVVPDLGGDRLAGQRGPGGRADEVQRGCGGHDADVVAGLGEQAQQLARLVGGDAAARRRGRPAACHVTRVARHRLAGQTPARRALPGLRCVDAARPSMASEVSRPALISRSAIDSGFSWTWVSTSGPTYSSRPSPSWE